MRRAALFALLVFASCAPTPAVAAPDPIVTCQAIGCPSEQTPSIPAGCAVTPCRTSDTSSSPATDPAPVIEPTPTARFTG